MLLIDSQLIVREKNFPDCEAAIRYFVNRGMTLRDETKRFDEQGRCIFVYFKEEVGGFAIHLVQD